MSGVMELLSDLENEALLRGQIRKAAEYNQAWAKVSELVEAAKVVRSGRHFHLAGVNGAFCERCGNYFTNPVHFRDGESEEADLARLDTALQAFGGEG